MAFMRDDGVPAGDDGIDPFLAGDTHELLPRLPFELELGSRRRSGVGLVVVTGVMTS